MRGCSAFATVECGHEYTPPIRLPFAQGRLNSSDGRKPKNSGIVVVVLVPLLLPVVVADVVSAHQTVPTSPREKIFFLADRATGQYLTPPASNSLKRKRPMFGTWITATNECVLQVRVSARTLAGYGVPSREALLRTRMAPPSAPMEAANMVSATPNSITVGWVPPKFENGELSGADYRCTHTTHTHPSKPDPCTDPTPSR